jgi:nucleotide-binding universal stress UspA family protein
MHIKTILVPVSGGDTDAAVLEAALVVAQRFGAHIEALHAQLDPRDAVPFLGEGASGALIQQIMEAAQRDAAARAGRARAAFDSWRQRAGLTLAETPNGGNAATAFWREEVGAEDELVARRGRLVDMIVVAQPTAGGNVVPTVSFEAALLDTGRPVLAVPTASGTLARLGEGPAVIAWNGSIEAARAIWAALPFLATTERVGILSVVEGGKAADASHVLSYLGWHGVKAQVFTPAVSGPAGIQILSEAERQQAGLLIMGAYTRSRLRRMVFGGVTEHVLANARLPVLMVH